MIIKEVSAKAVKDSRREKTIQVNVKTSLGKFITSAPAGKSTGEYETRSYSKSLEGDIKFMNSLDIENINNLIEKRGGKKKIDSANEAFDFIEDIEGLTDKNIGANTLFALEASLLKAIARENDCELWEFLLMLNSKIKRGGKLERSERLKIKFPRPVGNTIGGGMHSKGIRGKKPDFQEFLFIADADSFSRCVETNKKAYALAGKMARKSSGFWRKLNDEGAFETNLSNEEVLDIMKKVSEDLRKKKIKVDIGLDVAASGFFKKGFYEYKNLHKELDRNAQIKYIDKLVNKYNLFYVEDALEDNDFDGFAELMFEVRQNNCLVVGDDLTVTNPTRLEKADRLHSINAIIVKPNQIGSLLKVKKVIEMAKKAGIKTVISHRSGETLDNTIADLCVGFGCDFIKTGIHGSVRKAKLKRLIKIEKKVRG
jgi:enolase